MKTYGEPVRDSGSR